MNYQSQSNYSNNAAGTNRFGAATSAGGEEFLGPPTSIRSQTNGSTQKIAYLEKQNELLQEQVSQLQQSLEINKQIQSTILDVNVAAKEEKPRSNSRSSVIHVSND